MSISSEISRISGNVSDAFTAISAKGVTVPQGSTSDDLATLIGSIQTGGGGAAHTIYFEFSDGTDTTITGYWDSSFISDAITATTPSTYGQKTVTSAQLDGVEWYSYTPSTGTYETLLDDAVQILSGDPYGIFWISDLGSVTITAGSEWKITLDGTTYLLTASQIDGTAYIGNPKYADKTDDGSSTPFCFYNAGWGAWNGGCDTSISGTSDSLHSLKVERKVTA